MRKLWILFAASFLMLACTKEGPPGPAGRDANVSTYYITVYPNEWRSTGTYGTSGYYCFAEKSLNALTPAVIDHGAVLAYALLGNYDNQLPYVKSYRGFIETMRYDLQPGIIGFVIEDSDFKTEPPQTPIEYKIVIVGL